MHDGAAHLFFASFTPDDAVRSALAVRAPGGPAPSDADEIEHDDERHGLYVCAAGALRFDELASLCAITSDHD